MGFSLNSAVKPQSKALNKSAIIMSSESSPIKRPYVDAEKHHMEKSDYIYLLKNIKKIYRLPFTMIKTVNLIEKDIKTSKERKKIISREVFSELEILLKDAGVDDFGFFEIAPDKLFKDSGVPHRYGLVLSIGMDPKAFVMAPSIECQLEVANIYVKTGAIANKVASFLQHKGYGASPNHSMGGQLDYSMAVEWAGMGIVGRHSMGITKKNGPCHRLSVVYTNIENLGDFIRSDIEEMRWINDFCKSCGKCVRKCPTNAILSELTVIDSKVPTRIVYERCAEGFGNYGCGICIKECPFTGGKYESLKRGYESKQTKLIERLGDAP